MKEPINLDRAVEQICRVKDPGKFFFMVGAGISRPPVPVASEMIEDWKRMIGNSTPPPISSSKPTTLDLYEAWFRYACFDHESRQEYLRKKIQDQLLPPANYKLAKIVNDGKLTKIVVTTNFDTFLFKALGYLGTDPLLYDHPQSAGERFDMSRHEPQIIHVHGTYLFYDCANLRGEIVEQSEKMFKLLDYIFLDHSPIVVGYSGWVDDVFMSALKLRLESNRRLARNVYWFCFRQEDLTAQPGWLRDHDSVVFVVPEKKPDPTETSATLEQRNSTSLSQASEPVLPAEDVFDAFISALQIPESDLDKDPVTFFVSRLKNVLRGFNDREVKSISEVVKKVREGHGKLDAIEKQVAGRNYSEALSLSRSLSGEIRDNRFEASLATELIALVWKIATALPNDSLEVLGAYDCIEELGQWLGSIECLDSSACSFIAKARASKGLALLEQAKYAEAIAQFDQVIESYGNSMDRTLLDAVAGCRVNKGIALCRWKNPAQDGPETSAIFALYDSVIDSFNEAGDFVFRESVSSAKVNKAYLLNMIGRDDESVQLYQQVIDQYSSAVEPAIREHVARAMINKAFSLGTKSRRDETEAAIKLYRQVVDLFSSPTRPSMRAKLAVAWNGLGFQLLLLAKSKLQNGEEANETLSKAWEAIQEAKQLEPRSWMILGNEAYITFLLGKKEDARRLLTETLKAGGEEARAGELRDTTRFTISLDAEFAGWLEDKQGGLQKPEVSVAASNA